MRIDILTVLPEMIDGMLNCSILKRAQDKQLAEIHLHNLRDYTTNKWRRVDDYPFGGEAGMVMQIEPIDRAISALKAEREYDLNKAAELKYGKLPELQKKLAKAEENENGENKIVHSDRIFRIRENYGIAENIGKTGRKTNRNHSE